MAALNQMLFLQRLYRIRTPGGKPRNKSYELMENICNKTNGITSYQWCPENIISKKNTLRNGHVCMVLNRQIRIPEKVAQQLWENADIRCTVDGGTNRWLHFLNTHCKGRKMKPPDFITGDFDSVSEETLAFFSEPTTTKVHTPDQNATDFTKAVKVLVPLMEEKQLNDIVVFHEDSGRFDQIMANINTLFKVQTDKLHIHLVSGDAMTWLLRPGKHSIQIPYDLVEHGRWCSLIPIAGRVGNVTTSGLKWNLKNSVMEFGGMVSTSNTYASELVEIETDGDLIWSMGLFCFDEN